MPKIDPKLVTLIEASKLSLDDTFMQYQPVTRKGQNLKNSLVDLINSNPKDFYRPVIDPSFTENEEIVYVPGSKPAMSKTYMWWEEKAKEFWPERGSRLGTKSEYLAFLGVLIKKLVEKGVEARRAWDMVCNNSLELGNYKVVSYENGPDIEVTGSREVCGFFDLSNLFKILSEEKEVDENGLWIASGCCTEESNVFPLAAIDHFVGRYFNLFFGTGWIVFDR